jgi:hypothetical protein
LTLLGRGQAAEDTPLVGQVRGGGRVDEPATLRGQRDQDAAAVAGIGLAGHVTGRLEPVEPFGRAGHGQHQGRGEVGRAQPVRRPGTAQGGQDVVPARLETAGGVAGLKPPLDLPGQAGAGTIPRAGATSTFDDAGR